MARRAIIPTANAVRWYAQKGGPQPLEVLLGNMWFYWGHGEKSATDFFAALKNKNITPDQLLALKDEVLNYREKAGAWAVQAAPFCHPRLGTMKVEMKQDPGELSNVELVEQLTAIRESLAEEEPEFEFSSAAE